MSPYIRKELDPVLSNFISNSKDCRLMVALLTPCLLRGGRENIIHYDSAIQ
jgi:hypothetical protein